MAKKMSMSQAINEAMKLAMQRDENVILMGEDVAGGAQVDHLQDDEAWGGVLGVTKGLVQEFGRERVLDTPITEAGYVGAAMAAAATGLRPIAELMFNDFIGSCLDQVLNQGAKFRYMFGGKAQVPVTIRTTHGAGFRAAAQHSQACMRCSPPSQASKSSSRPPRPTRKGCCSLRSRTTIPSSSSKIRRFTI